MTLGSHCTRKNGDIGAVWKVYILTSNVEKEEIEKKKNQMLKSDRWKEN